MAEIYAENPGDIVLTIQDKQYPVKRLNSSATFHEELIRTGRALLGGHIEQTGYIEVGDWLTEEQKSDLLVLMRRLTRFVVTVPKLESLGAGHQICTLLNSEQLPNGSHVFFYMVMAGSTLPA